jgi:hypothetical protein
LDGKLGADRWKLREGESFCGAGDDPPRSRTIGGLMRIGSGEELRARPFEDPESERGVSGALPRGSDLWGALSTRGVSPRAGALLPSNLRQPPLIAPLFVGAGCSFPEPERARELLSGV